MFKQPLNDILNGWVPEPGDILAPKQVPILSTGYWMVQIHLAATWVGEEGLYQWNVNTASVWMTILCYVIKEAKQLAHICGNLINNVIDSDTVYKLSKVLTALLFLSYHTPICQLLSLCSVESKLNAELNAEAVVSE